MFVLAKIPLSMKSGSALNRKDQRKLARKQKKQKRLLFSKKKRIFKKQNSSFERINHTTKGNLKKRSLDEDAKWERKGKGVQYSRKKLNVKPKEQTLSLHNDKKYDIYAEQEKDDLLLLYLSKKLKLNSNRNNNKNNEEKLFKDLEKDGFDSNLLKLTDVIFSEFQKNYKNKDETKKKDKNSGKQKDILLRGTKNNQENSASGEGDVTNDIVSSVIRGNTEIKEKLISKKRKKEGGANQVREIYDDEEAKDEKKRKKKGKAKAASKGKTKCTDKVKQKLGEMGISKGVRNKEMEIIKNSNDKQVKKGTHEKRKEIVKIEKQKKKELYPYSEEVKKMDKFLIISLNKTSEFNIKCIIQDICKYFHELKDLKLKVTFNEVLIKIISNHFKNVNITDTHICICVIIICILNSLIYQNLMKDFFNTLTGIFKYYYENNITLMKKIERENEFNSNNPNILHRGKNDTDTAVLNLNELYKRGANPEYLTHEKEKNKMENSITSKEEYEKYENLKIIFRNVLKCISMFYALNYLDFDCITDVINILCEQMSVNNVDNIIIILKICGMKLESDDISHLNYVTEYLKKQIDLYVTNNNIYIERSKLRFLIKDIDDLKRGKMKFYFLNKFEFLFSVLKEFECKYNFKRKVLSFPFLNVFKRAKFSRGIGSSDMKEKQHTPQQKMKKKRENKIEKQDHLNKVESPLDVKDDKTTNLKNVEALAIEGKFHKLNYLMVADEEYFNQSYFNKLLKKYKIQGILPKKIFLIIKNSLDVDECVHNLSLILKEKKNIPYVIQTVIQTLLYDNKFKVAYARILSSISNFKNRVFLFSLKTIFINYVKNINNYDLKKVLFLSKLFIYLLKEKLLNFQIFKFIQIDEEEKVKTIQEQNYFNTSFFFKTIFILISLDDNFDDRTSNNELWNHIFECILNKGINSSITYSFKGIINKYIFDEVENILCVYPNFQIEYIQKFYNFLEKQKK
ncbi:conserved Plasmodium protein, unknown function [Plasmodium malariae]|uniref:MI domain-containing protein n=1 Tax=Plasmodium malariae TaxID=5858 RepID=A0A1D3TDA4_PLAMA|nr:conserved Plasmodium protein, unknown function [Plasmodium malariae]SCP02822.1 conserved Plasmodium protein, unknown function [Plasmodium malariae]